MSRGSARLPTHSVTAPTSTSPHEKASGRSHSRPDSSPASRAYEDTPFVPPLESTSLDNIRRDLPQLHDPRPRHHHTQSAPHFAQGAPYSTNTGSGRFDPASQAIFESAHQAGSHHTQRTTHPPRGPGVLIPDSPELSAQSLSSQEPFPSSSAYPQQGQQQRSDDGPTSPFPDAGPILRSQLQLDPTAPISLRSLPDPPTGMRPTQPLPLLTKLAIYGSPRRMLTLQEIYAALEDRFEWYRNSDDKAWKNSIRHNLSLNKVFRSIQRPITDPGKGNYWYLDLSEGEGYKRPRKRRAKYKPTQSTTDGEEETSEEDSSPTDDEPGYGVEMRRAKRGSRRSSPYQRSVSPVPRQSQAQLSLNTNVGGNPMNMLSLPTPHTISPSSASAGSAYPASSPAMQPSFNAYPYGQPSFGRPSFGQPLLPTFGQPSLMQSSAASFQMSHARSGRPPMASASTSMGPFSNAYFPGPASAMYMSGYPMTSQPVTTGPDFRLGRSPPNPPRRGGGDMFDPMNASYNLQAWTPDIFRARDTTQDPNVNDPRESSSSSQSPASGLWRQGKGKGKG